MVFLLSFFRDFELPFMIHLEDEENDDTTAEEDTSDDESSESGW
jgi:hypothetical protein